MLIRKLILKNFKSHKFSEIEFDLITSFIGTSDHGKTNIIRALKLILFNEAWPSNWISWGQKESEITLEFCSGLIVTRYRTKTKQGYKIVKPDGSEEDYSGKNDLGSILEDLTGFRKVVLDEASGPENLNWMDIHDAPFMLGLSPLAVQRKIAGLLGTSQLEEARTELNNEKKKLLKDLEAQESNLESKQSFLTASSDKFNVADNLLNAVEDIYTNWNKLSSNFQQINDIIDIHSSITYRTDNLDSELHKLRVILDTLKQFRTLTLKLNYSKPVPVNLEELDELKKKLYVLKIFRKTKDLINCKIKLSRLEAIYFTKQKELEQLKINSVCPKCGKLI